MLTQKENEWLNNRDNHAEHFCRWCDVWEDCMGELDGIFCPSLTQKVQLREAAEFSERVAVKLVRWENAYHKGDRLCPYGDTELDSYIPLCHCTDFCQSHPKLGCIAAKLAWVQLHVEEEMDGEAK